MKALLSFLWSGCWHRWKIIDRAVVDHYLWARDKRPYETRSHFTLQCQKCGRIGRGVGA